MKKYNEFYFEICDRQMQVINETLSEENVRLFSDAHLLTTDFEKWLEYISGNPELVLYRTAIDEYSSALFLVACGFYRQAYMSLRFFLEHALFGILLSSNELGLRLWSIDKNDVKWAAITSDDTGIFSHGFFTAFAPDLISYRLELLGISAELYREFSEYTHGNPSATKSLPGKIQFSDAVFRDIIKRVDAMRYLLIFLFFARYKNKLSTEAISNLEQPVMEVIGNKPEVEAFFTLVERSGTCE